MDNLFRTINTMCDENLIPYYTKLLSAIDSCPSTAETRALRAEAEAIRALIESLESKMTEIDLKIAKKYNF